MYSESCFPVKSFLSFDKNIDTGAKGRQETILFFFFFFFGGGGGGGSKFIKSFFGATGEILK